MKMRQTSILFAVLLLIAAVWYLSGCANGLEEGTPGDNRPALFEACIDLGIDTVINLENDEYKLVYKWKEGDIDPSAQSYLFQYTVFADSTRQETLSSDAKVTSENTFEITVYAPKEEVPRCVETLLKILDRSSGETIDTLELLCGSDVVLFYEGVVWDDVVIFRATDSTTVDSICTYPDTLCEYIAFLDTTVTYEPPESTETEDFNVGLFEAYNIYLFEDLRTCFCVDSIRLDTTAFRQCMDTLKTIAFSIKAANLPENNICFDQPEPDESVSDD
ncbi:MAG: hypothetical protein J5I94_27310 [Phaeodactylibacter sp.]|nr:hypothetical protein [Phaeodactylibacter sp.]